jgi:hypothetical protein
MLPGSASTARAWREAYLTLTYAAGDYRPYESLVALAAQRRGLDADLAARLVARRDELQRLPETPRAGPRRSGIGPDRGRDQLFQRPRAPGSCPDRRAVRRGRHPPSPRERTKPRPEPYQRAVAELGLPAGRVLFVAGSRYDIAGAMAAGMPVWWHNRVGMPRGRPQSRRTTASHRYRGMSRGSGRPGARDRHRAAGLTARVNPADQENCGAARRQDGFCQCTGLPWQLESGSARSSPLSPSPTPRWTPVGQGPPGPRSAVGIVIVSEARRRGRPGPER